VLTVVRHGACSNEHETQYDPKTLTFTPGHFYSSSNGTGSQDIYEYDETGTFLSSMIPRSLMAGDELRGIAFGPDGFLYAVKSHFAEVGFQILALDSSGRTQVTYTKADIGLGGDSGYGKIAFDQKYIYVAAGSDLIRFTFGNSDSGESIYSNNAIIDVKPLPSGDLFVAWAYGIDEITNTGTFVRTIPLVGADWSNVQGIEYDPLTDTLFATQIGDFLFMRINASNGELEEFVTLSYGNDLFLTPSNTLLVGSYTQAPGIFDENLTPIGSLGSEARVFVTEDAAGAPTPTPTATATASSPPSPTPTATPTATVSPSPTPTPTPSACTVNITDPFCDSVINTQPVDFSVNLSDPTNPSSIQPTDFTVNGTPADSYMTSNFFQLVFHFNTSPVVQGLNVMHIPACAFVCSIGCTSEFTCTFTGAFTATPTPRPTPAPRPRPTPAPRP